MSPKNDLEGNTFLLYKFLNQAMSRLDRLKNKSEKVMLHQKKWIKRGKKVLLLIKSFVVDKQQSQKAVNNAVFRVL